MHRPSHRLFLLSLLLLVPLGALKWRANWLKEWQAEHPPVSEMDKLFRAIVSNSDAVNILGGNPVWHEVTHLPDNQMIVIKDRSLLAQLTNSFRLGDEPWPADGSSHDEDITIWVPSREGRFIEFLSYYRNLDGKTSYVVCTAGDGREEAVVKVQLRFGPHFEALVRQLAQRATAPGQHPGIVLKSWKR